MNRWTRHFAALLIVLLSCARALGGTFTLDTPKLLANGYQMGFNVASGTCNGAITVDPTKISIALTSDGFNSSGVLGTIARTITIVSATVSGSTLTCNLSEPIFNDDVSVSVTLQAAAFTDVTPDTSDALGSTAVDIVTTPSTLDYPLHSGIHFIDPPHQRYTGSTFDLRALGLHQYGWAAVKMGITRQLAVTGTGGITGTYTYPETVTFAGVGPGGTGVLAPGSDLTGAGTKVLRVFMRTGVATVGDTATGGTSGATIIVTSTAGGGETSGFATFTTRTRDGSYGPATIQDVWSYTITPPAVDRYERWFIFYPAVGDTSWDSRSLSVRAASNTMTGDSCRGEWEIFCDPGDTLSASQKSYYVDTTTIADASGGTTGTFGQFEFCKVENPGDFVHQNIVVAIGDNSAGTQSTTNFRYNSLPFGVVAYTVDQTGSEPTGIEYGDIIAVAGTYGSSTITGFVLNYNATTKILTYLLTANTAFTAASSMATYDRDGVSQAITFTLGTPATATTNAVASGDIITGYSSGATCTLTGVPAANGSDSNTGTSLSPFLTQQKCIKQASTDRGDSIGDGVTIYLKRGLHWQKYAAGNDTETRDYWATITKAPGIETDNVRITRYDTASSNGNNTNFERFYQVTFWGWSSTSGIYVLASASTTPGNFDRKALWIDSCEVVGFFRWSLSQISTWINASGPYYFAITNSRVSRHIVAAHMYRDVAYTTTANDTTTQGRCVVNLSIDNVSATGTNFHSDIWQGQGTEGGNLLIWGLKATNLSNVQIAPFINSSAGTVSLNSYGFVNLMQAADDTTNVPQVVNSTAASTLTLSGWTWVDCVYPEIFYWTATAAGRNLTLDNLRMACSVWTDIDDVAIGTISGIYAGSYYNNHYVSAPDSGTYNPYTDTITTTFTDLFTEATDDDAAGFLVPKAASVLLDRSPASARPNGWPKHDVFGRLRSQDAAGQASIGAAQPFPTLTATYDGDSISDGGTVTETAGTKNLVMSAATGIVGSVVYISSAGLGGTVTGTDASPYTLTAGGSTESATIVTTLAAGAGTIDISYDLSSVFDFDITGQSGAGFFRQRGGKRQRWPRRHLASRSRRAVGGAIA